MRKSQRILFYTMLLMMLVPPGLYVLGHQTGFVINSKLLGADDELLMESGGVEYYQLVKLLDTSYQDSGCVLVFRQAEYAYYGTRCFVSYVDDRLLPFYNAVEPKEAIQILMSLNITYFLTPAYGMTEIYDSVAGRLLGDPKYTELISSRSGNGLYRLRSESILSSKPYNVLYRYKTNDFYCLENSSCSEGKRIEDIKKSNLTNVHLIAGESGKQGPSVEYVEKISNEAGLLQLDATLEGNGFGKIYLFDYEPPRYSPNEGWSINDQLIWDGIVENSRHVKIQILRYPGQSQRPRIGLSYRGAKPLGEIDISVRKYAIKPVESQVTKQSQAQSAGWQSFALFRGNTTWNWGIIEEGESKAVGMQVKSDRCYVLSSPIISSEPWPRMIDLEYVVKSSSDLDIYVEWLTERGAKAPNPVERVLNFGQKYFFNDVLSYDVVTGARSFYEAPRRVTKREQLETMDNPGGDGYSNLLGSHVLLVPNDSDAMRILFIFPQDEKLPVATERTMKISRFILSYEGESGEFVETSLVTGKGS